MNEVQSQAKVQRQPAVTRYIVKETSPICFRGNRRPFWMCTLFSISVLILGCQPTQPISTGVEKSPAVITVNTIVAQRDVSEGERRIFTGLVKPSRSVQLGFSRGGKIASINVTEAATVETGQLLAELENQRLTNKRDLLQAAYDQAKQNLASIPSDPPTITLQQLIDELRSVRGQALQLENDLVRAAGVRQPQSAETVQQLTEIERRFSALNPSAISQKRNELNQLLQDLDAKLTDAKLEVEEGRLLSPFPGKIELQPVDVGSVVAAGMPIVRLIDVSTLLVTASIPSSLAETLTKGSPAKVSIGGQFLELTTDSKAPELDQTTRTRRVSFRFAESAGMSFQPGELASIELSVGDGESGFWLPQSALTREFQGLWSVLVAEPENGEWIASRRYVDVVRSEMERVLVRGSLTDGELVIADGIHRIVPGQRVQPPRSTASVNPTEQAEVSEATSQGDGGEPTE